MTKAWKIIKWFLLVILGAFIVIQFIRPAKTNPPAQASLAIDAHTQIAPPIKDILNRSCSDCHSNNTVWPWYSNLAPVSWFVINHVNEGRQHLNFSEWGNLDNNRQRRKLDEMCEMVEGGEMPLTSYTPMHPGSKLSAQDVKTLCDWTNAERQRLSSL
jgi:hypothetical protein